MTKEKEEEPKGPVRTLAAKICDIMAECEHIPKNGRNDSQGYDYVTESDVSHAIRKLLIKHRVICLPSLLDHKTTQYTTAKGTVMNYVTCTVAYNFVNAENPTETYTLNEAGHGSDSGDKGIYKALTGLHKYMLLRAFCLPTGDDPEIESDEDKPKAKVEEKAKAKPKPTEPAPEFKKADPASEVSKLIAEGKYKELGAWTIETDCSKKSRPVDHLFTNDFAWIKELMIDKKRLATLLPDDRNAIIYYGKYLENTKKGEEDGK